VTANVSAFDSHWWAEQLLRDAAQIAGVIDRRSVAGFAA
jgi:hypothetical protein